MRRCLIVIVAEEGFGAPSPELHGIGGVAHRQPDKRGHEAGLVVSEQACGAVGEVGDDGVDLPTRQRAVVVGGRGDGKLA